MLKALRTTVNEIMAMAVSDLFPGVLLGEGKVTETQFSYRFLFEGPQHPDLLAIVAEKMREIIKNHPPIECIEMAAKSAESYFEHHGQPFKADAVFDLDTVLVPFIRIGEFYDLIFTTPHSEVSGSSFQLLDANPYIENDQKWIEIVGTAFDSKDELKAFIKKRKQWLKEKPWQEAENQGLLIYDQENPILLPKGLKIFRQLEAFWLETIEKKGGYTEVLGLKTSCMLNYPTAEWAVPSKDRFGPQDLCRVTSSSAELIKGCISSLHFIYQTFNMLELSTNWVLFTKNPGNVHTKQWDHQVNALKKALSESGFSYSVDEESCKLDPTVELQIFDSLGEKWAGPFLSICGKVSENTSQGGAIVYSLLGPVKRLIALMAEQKVSLKRLNVGES